MSCERCGGFIVTETFHGMSQEDSQHGMPTVRCVNCGNCEDATIRRNRLTSHAQQQSDRYREGLGTTPAGWPNRWQRMTKPEGPISQLSRNRELRPCREIASAHTVGYEAAPTGEHESSAHQPGRSA